MLLKYHLPALILVSSLTLVACGGGGGGGSGDSPPADIKQFAGLAGAQALIVTGATGAKSKAHGVECQNGDGDDGFFIEVNGEEVCQAYFEKETIYAVNADGVRARVRYLDENGNELDRQDYAPEHIYDAGNSHLLADFFFNSNAPGAASERQTVLAARSSGAAYRLPPTNGLDAFEEELSAFELNSRTDYGPRKLTTRSGQLLFVQSSVNVSLPALFQASLAAAGDLQGIQRSPNEQIVNSFVAAANGSRVLYLRGGGTGDSWAALDLANRSFKPVGTPAMSGNNFEQSSFDDSIYAPYLHGPDGQSYLGSEYHDEDNSLCKAHLYRLSIDGSLNVSTSQISESGTASPLDAKRLCPAGLFRRFQDFDSRWVAAGDFGIFLELNWSASPSLRYIENPDLANAEFVLDLDKRGAAVATPSYLYLLGQGSSDSENRIYRASRGGDYAGSFINFGHFEANSIRAFVGDNIIVDASDKANGDAVVLQLNADGSTDVLSRNDSVEIVAIERLN